MIAALDQDLEAPAEADWFSAAPFPAQPGDGTPVRAGFAGPGPELPPADPHLLLARFGHLIDQRVARVSGHLLRPSFDRDDLRQEGRLGLLRAAAAFDPARGVPFLSYARTVIDNALTDVLRAHDPLPTTVRRDLKALAAAQSPDPDASRAAALAAVSAKRASLVRSWDQLSRTVPLDGGPDTPEVSDRTARTPEDVLVDAEERRQVSAALAGLPDRTRRILWSRLVEARSVREVAAAEGISPSRVWQIQEQAQAALAVTLTAWGDG